jgi:nucleoside-diphosphate-sugar epimerase
MSLPFENADGTSAAQSGQRVILTGGTGFIGRHVVAKALSQGWQVSLLGRSASTYPNTAFFAWDLTELPPKEELAEAECLIHLATDTRFESEAMSEDAEVESAGALFAAAAAARIVFVSSQSSNPAAFTRYGRVKARIEVMVRSRNGVVIRPGLVFGGDCSAGLHARLCNIVRVLPFIPDLRPAAFVQLVHVDDLAEAILRASAPKFSSGTYQVGDVEGMSMSAYLRAIARVRYGLWRPLIAIPRVLLLLAARFGAPALKLLKIDPSSIIGLFALKRMETAASLRALDMELRPFHDGLRPNSSSTRRELLMEGRALFGFLCPRMRPIGVLKRYVRAIEAVDGGQPLLMSMKYLAWPCLLHLVEEKGIFRRHARYPELQRRLDIAARVAEASTDGARQFMAIRATSYPVAFISLCAYLAGEMVWQVLRIGWGPMLRDHDRN